MSDEWGGTPAMGGWHWLRRRDNAAWRLGFWDRMRCTWRVTDAIGRTSGKSPFHVAPVHVSRPGRAARGAEAMSVRIELRQLGLPVAKGSWTEQRRNSGGDQPEVRAMKRAYRRARVS